MGCAAAHRQGRMRTATTPPFLRARLTPGPGQHSPQRRPPLPPASPPPPPGIPRPAWRRPAPSAARVAAGVGLRRSAGPGPPNAAMKSKSSAHKSGNTHRVSACPGGRVFRFLSQWQRPAAGEVLRCEGGRAPRPGARSLLGALCHPREPRHRLCHQQGHHSLSVGN